MTIFPNSNSEQLQRINLLKGASIIPQKQAPKEVVEKPSKMAVSNRLNLHFQCHGFTQLFLISTVCIHWQLCQCFAGGNVNCGMASPTSLFAKMMRKGNIQNDIHSNSRQKFGFGSSCNYNWNRLFDLKLKQASTVASIEDEEGSETRGISIRGGGVESTAEVESQPIIEQVVNESSVAEDEINAEKTMPSDDALAPLHSSPVQEKRQIDESISNTVSRKRKWPCGDELDKQLIKITLPCIANFAINPLVGAVDLFWINRMGNTLAVAGQAAANQIFTSSFWLTSFLPSGKIFS